MDGAHQDPQVRVNLSKLCGDQLSLQMPSTSLVRDVKQRVAQLQYFDVIFDSAPFHVVQVLWNSLLNTTRVVQWGEICTKQQLHTRCWDLKATRTGRTWTATRRRCSDFTYDQNTGEILSVSPDSLGDHAGVRVGCTMVKIDGLAFSHELFQSKLPFSRTVTFAKVLGVVVDRQRLLLESYECDDDDCLLKFLSGAPPTLSFTLIQRPVWQLEWLRKISLDERCYSKRTAGFSLSEVPSEFLSDYSIVRAVVEKWPRAFEDVLPIFQSNSKIALSAVRGDGLLLQYADPELRGRFDVVEAAVHQNWRALEYAAAWLRDDPSLLNVAGLCAASSTFELLQFRNNNSTSVNLYLWTSVASSSSCFQ